MRVLEAHHWSRRGAQIATGVNYSVIQQMAQGLAPSALRVIEWARGIGEDPATWLRWAGHGDAVRLLGEQGGGAQESPPETGMSREPRIEHYAAVPEEMVEGYGALDEDEKRLVEEMIRRLAGRHRKREE